MQKKGRPSKPKVSVTLSFTIEPEVLKTVTKDHKKVLLTSAKQKWRDQISDLTLNDVTFSGLDND